MSAQKNVKKTTPKDPYPLDILCDYISRGFLWAMVLIFPLYMNGTKYSAITKCKSNTFTVFFTLATVFIIITAALYLMTHVKPIPSLRDKYKNPPFIADVALLAYWVLTFISSVGAVDPVTAFFGLDPRNNGFLFQTMYVATYFIISRGLRPKKTDALVFAWGGAILSLTCISHFFGHDLYNVASVVGSKYSGPFYNDDTYRFLGPVGNVNLGSYIIAICVVIAAGLYINKVALKFDKYNLITLACFAICLYAELNINTDAGIVALAAAMVLIPPVLCTSLDHLRRALHIYGTAALVVLLNYWLLGCVLGSERFGKTGYALAAIAVILLAVSFVIPRIPQRFHPSAKALRAAAVSLVSLMVIAGVALSIVITEPAPTPAGSVAGAVRAVEHMDYEAKTDSMLHELGQILRGNFDDDFGHNRLFTWKRTLRLVKLRPLLGIGPDNFKAFFASYFHDEAVIQFPASGGGIDKAHNEFLDILISGGILGLAAALA
ncbi:MAG: O-antigen ligase family protein, partial [Clostridia bacterium]|nr:O-antigen ligase family protein [Clostridia bacterium]